MPNSQANDQDQISEVRRFIIRRNPLQRLDKYLRQRLKGISRNQIQKLIDSGGVKVNDQVAKASTVVRKNDVLVVQLPPPPPKYLEPEPIALNVLYEDVHFIVVNKQSGLVVHPARSHLSGTLVNALAHHFAKQSVTTPYGSSKVDEIALSNANDPDFLQSSRYPLPSHSISFVGTAARRPGIVHRLDKNTTGVMVVAKTDIAHGHIAQQFEARSTLKAYLAIVHREVEGIGGVVDAPIGKHPTIREAYAVRHDRCGKPSVTLYRVRERYQGYTLLELEPKTGRTHQIRVHMAYLGHPIIGDILYGGEVIGRHELDHPPTAFQTRRFTTFARNRDDGIKLEAEAQSRSDLLLPHTALHAALLRITHPVSLKHMTFSAPLHEPMATVIRELRQHSIDGPVANKGYWVPSIL